MNKCIIQGLQQVVHAVASSALHFVNCTIFIRYSVTGGLMEPAMGDLRIDRATHARYHWCTQAHSTAFTWRPCKPSDIVGRRLMWMDAGEGKLRDQNQLRRRKTPTNKPGKDRHRSVGNWKKRYRAETTRLTNVGLRKR